MAAGAGDELVLLVVVVVELVVVVWEEVEREGELEAELLLLVVLLELGGVEDEVEVEVEDEELVVVVDVADGAGAHDSLSDTIGPVIGRFIAEIGVPGATFTLNVYVCPPTTVTVTVHASADADGGAVKGTPRSTATTVAARASSLRGRLTAAVLLWPSSRGRS